VSTLTYYFHQCPGVMLGFIRGMVKRAQLVAYAFRDERSPGPEYGTGTGNQISGLKTFSRKVLQMFLDFMIC